MIGLLHRADLRGLRIQQALRLSDERTMVVRADLARNGRTQVSGDGSKGPSSPSWKTGILEQLLPMRDEPPVSFTSLAHSRPPRSDITSNSSLLGRKHQQITFITTNLNQGPTSPALLVLWSSGRDQPSDQDHLRSLFRTVLRRKITGTHW